MLSSWQIASMHAQQGQMFGAQQAYSQQLSTMMPPAYQGLGASGFGGGFQPGGGYSYGGSGMGGYGPGNSFGNRATSFVGGAANTFGSAMSLGGMVGGFAMGGPIGGAIGLGAGIIGGGIKHIANNFMEGAHEQASMERTLSQFQFSNAEARGGKGFSRTDSMAIGNMVRQMERIPEMLTSFGELNRIMDKMGQMGLMQGVRDVGEFSKKFRDTVSALKDMSKILGTTMEGALNSLSEARRSGIYGQGDIVKNALQRSIVGSMTGMNQDQVGQLQMFGGQLGHATGGSRRTGAQLALRTAGQLGMANQMGILSNDQIMEMTGKEGAEGIEELAGDFSQLAYRMGNSNVGQALTLALGEMKGGKYTGKMDAALVEKVRSGQLSLSELKRMARSKAGTRGAKLSFAAHKSRLRSEMAGSVGAEGIGMQLQEILGERGWENPDAVNLVMQRFGANEEQANLLQQMMPNLSNIGGDMALMQKQEARRAAVNSVNKEHGWEAIKHRIGKNISHYTSDWAKDIGAGVRDYFQNWADEFMDDLSGQYREYVTKRVTDIAKFSSTGLGKLAGNVASMRNSLGGGRIDVGSSGGLSGLASRAANFLSGMGSAGEDAVDIIRGSGGGSLLSTESRNRFLGPLGGLSLPGMLMKGGAQRLSESGATVLTSNLGGGATGITAGNLQKAQELVASLGTKKGSDEMMAKLRGVLSADEITKLQGAFDNAMSSGEISQIADPMEREKAIMNSLKRQAGASAGSGYEDNKIMSGLMKAGSRGTDIFSKLERAGVGREQVVSALQGTGGFRGDVNFQSLSEGRLLGLTDMGNQRAIGQRIEGLNKSLSGSLTGTETTAGWLEIRKLIDEGGEMSNLFGGAKGGIVGDEKLRKILSKSNPSDWSSEDKSALAAAGIDPSKMAAKLSTPEGQKEVDRLLSAAASGKLKPGDIANYKNLTDLSSLNAIASGFRERGKSVAKALTSATTKDAREALKQSKEGRELLSLLQQNAYGLQEAGFDKEGSWHDAVDNTAQIVQKLTHMSEKNRKLALETAGTEINSSYQYSQGVRKSLSGVARRGGSAQDILNAAGYKDQEVGDEFRKNIENAIKGGSSKGLDKSEIENVVKILVEAQSKGLTGKAGTTQQTAMASEAEVAKSLSSLSENNVKMAAILSGIASGKSVADSLAELPGGKK
jgi:hypothetical protein